MYGLHVWMFICVAWPFLLYKNACLPVCFLYSFDASGVMNEFHSIFLVGINFLKDLGF